MSGPVGALALSQGNKLLLASVCVSLDTGETETEAAQKILLH